jgi:hypothetical protein
MFAKLFEVNGLHYTDSGMINDLCQDERAVAIQRVVERVSKSETSLNAARKRKNSNKKYF